MLYHHSSNVGVITECNYFCSFNWIYSLLFIYLFFFDMSLLICIYFRHTWISLPCDQLKGVSYLIYHLTLHEVSDVIVLSQDNDTCLFLTQWFVCLVNKMSWNQAERRLLVFESGHPLSNADSGTVCFLIKSMWPHWYKSWSCIYAWSAKEAGIINSNGKIKTNSEKAAFLCCSRCMKLLQTKLFSSTGETQRLLKF